MGDRIEGRRILRIRLEENKDCRERIEAILAELDSLSPQCPPRCITILGEGDGFLWGESYNCEIKGILSRLDELQVPVIVGVNGKCNGIGMALLQYADLAVAANCAEIEGYESVQRALDGDAVNWIVPEEKLAEAVEDYALRLLQMPEELISFGHKLYFALEKLPDRLSRSEYGASVIGEIMAIQAELNQKHPEDAMPLFSEQEFENIHYKNENDKTHAILFEIRDRVEYIQLNMPHTHNMLDWRASMELAGAYALANAQPDLKAIVVTGIGKWFHLGGIRYCQEDEYERARFADQLKLRNQIMREICVPLISVVNGECSGGGMSLVLKSDRVIAVRDAMFGYPEIKHNGFACNSMVNTMDVIPKKAALNMFYFGELFSAQKAKQYGIVDEVVSEEELEQTIQGMLIQM